MNADISLNSYLVLFARVLLQKAAEVRKKKGTLSFVPTVRWSWRAKRSFCLVVFFPTHLKERSSDVHKREGPSANNGEPRKLVVYLLYKPQLCWLPGLGCQGQSVEKGSGRGAQDLHCGGPPW